MASKVVLPTLADLHHDIEVAFKHDKLNLLLNQQPPESWVKKHPFAKTLYIPIERVEFLLTRIYQNWRVEVLDSKALFNSVAVTIRLHYCDPITGQWSYQDGVGAMSVQTDKGASASDLSAIKSDAIMKALPAAKSYAVKDAAEQLGVIFGKNLNRKDVIAFAPAYADDTRERDRVIEWLKSDNATPAALYGFNENPTFAKYIDDEEIQKLINEKK